MKTNRRGFLIGAAALMVSLQTLPRRNEAAEDAQTANEMWNFQFGDKKTEFALIMNADGSYSWPKTVSV